MVVYLFDPPHLFKSLRNAFYKYDVKVGGGTAKWDHIRTFYSNDRTTMFQIAPKLTKEHIDPQ